VLDKSGLSALTKVFVSFVFPTSILVQLCPHIEKICMGLGTIEPCQDCKAGPCTSPDYHRCLEVEDDIAGGMGICQLNIVTFQVGTRGREY
jgi:hypothetical protein